MNKGGTPENLKPFKKGQSGNPKGRPKGGKNRATVLRELMALTRKGKDPITGESKDFTHEELMCMSIMKKAIEKGDVQAFNAIYDSLYGKAKSSDELKLSGDPSAPLEITVNRIVHNANDKPE